MDAKKFVVAFLILAALGSSSALLLARSNPNPSAATEDSFASSTDARNAALTYANAFASSSSAGIASLSAAGVVMAPASSSDNLTSQVLDAYVANTDIAPLDSSPSATTDTLSVVAPNELSLASALASSSLLAKVQIPDWDRDAAMQPLLVSSDTSAAAVNDYANALENIFNQYVVKGNLLNMVADPNAATPENVSLASTNLDGAMKALTAQPVPADFVDLQKSIVRVATYDKNTIALTSIAQADPVKASVVAQGEQKGMNAALADLQIQWQKALSNGVFAAAIEKQPGGRQNAAVAFIDGIAGIPVAHAQYTDFVAFAQRIGLYLLDFAEQVALQLIKDGIVQRIQAKVFSLIRNSGNPLFLQAFGPFLSGAFNVAAGAALGELDPTLCGNFSTDVGKWLKNAFKSANWTAGGVSLNGSPGTNCTLQSAIPNIPGYYQNFNTAGFTGFVALLQPSNNPYGAFMEAMDSVNAVAFSNEQAAQAKAIASQGFTGQQQCGNGTAVTGSTCPNGTEPVIHTPGATLRDWLGRSNDGSIKLTVSATNVIGILATVAANQIMSAINASGIL